MFAIRRAGVGVGARLQRPLASHAAATASRRGIFQLLTPPERVTYADSRAVPFSASQIFRVVADIDRYKQFVPFCVDSRVLPAATAAAATASGPFRRRMEAELVIGFGMFTERYTSTVTLNGSGVDSVLKAAKSGVTPSLITATAAAAAAAPSMTQPILGVRAEAIPGPDSLFKHLISEWKFYYLPPNHPSMAAACQARGLNAAAAGAATGCGPDGHGEGWCLSNFEIDFAVRSHLHAQAVKLFFRDVTERQIRAFEMRCSQLYPATNVAQRIVTPKPAPASTAPKRPAAATSAPAAATAPRVRMPILTIADDVSTIQRTLRTRYPFVDYSIGELERAKHVFANFGRIDRSPSATTPAGPTSGLLDFDGFMSVVSRSADRDAVFTRFRDRYALRAAAQNPALGRRLFLSCFPPAATTALSSLALSVSAAGAAAPATAAATAAAAPQTYQQLDFERFLENFYFLTKASQQQRLLHHFTRLATHHPAVTLASKTANDTNTSAPNPSAGAAAASGSDPDSLLRASEWINPLARLPRSVMASVTIAYFRLQIDVLQHVIPQMLYNRSKQMDDENRDIPPVDRGVQLLVALGVVEDAITQIEHQIPTALTQLANDRSVTDAAGIVSIARWTDSLLQQNDLLNVLSVRGMSTLIQWASATSAKPPQPASQP